MIIVIIFVVVITLMGIRVRVSNDTILSKQDTNIMNGIFVIFIFLSHSTQYFVLGNSLLDSLYKHFQNFHNQWVVTTFLAFSGYGVMSQIKRGGKIYIKKYPKNRILKTLFNFDIAILLYLVLNLLIKEKYSTLTILGSFIGITSIGNSNWYIFAILIMYIFSYMVAVLFKEDYQKQANIVSIATIFYIIVMQIIDMPSRFISTICCYPLGVWLSLYKNNIINLFKRKKIISLFVLAILLTITYKLRYNDYIMNFASCIFVLAIVWFHTFFEIKSNILQFIGQHAFSIFILQRIPMQIFKKYGVLVEQPYVFVGVSFIITIIISVGFDWAIGRIDKKIFS